MDSLDNLYAEDADWNQILNEFSSEAIKSHIRMIKFLKDCNPVDVGDEKSTNRISPSVLLPKSSTVVYEADQFYPSEFYKPFLNAEKVKWAWITNDKKTVFFVTFQNPKVKWTKSSQVTNRDWEIYLAHFIDSRKLIFIHSSDTSTLNNELASALTKGNANIVQGDVVFRSLGKINRLTFQKVGLKRPGRRNISYSSFSGVDVGPALTEAQKSVAAKSDIHGSGYESGKPVTVGCSMKGRIWERNYSSIDKYLLWCAHVADKLQDTSIDTSKVLGNTMIPSVVDSLPASPILKVDWPMELLTKKENRVKFHGNTDFDISMCELRLISTAADRKSYDFEVTDGQNATQYRHALGGTNKYSITKTNGTSITLEIGSKTRLLEEFLFDYPPSVLLVDGSELDGCLLFKMENREIYGFPPADTVAWDWSGVDITVESKWKDGTARTNSIQAKVIEKLKANSLDIVFDDDNSGEAADVISLNETDDDIELCLFHCKFSGAATPGQRVKDIMEVSAQAVKSIRWLWNFGNLCEHLSYREQQALTNLGRSRFESGNKSKLNKIKRASFYKPIKSKIYIVQPGVTKSLISQAQLEVLTSAHTYLLETVNIPLSVICSP